MATLPHSDVWLLLPLLLLLLVVVVVAEVVAAPAPAEEEDRGWVVMVVSSYRHTTIKRGKSFIPELTNSAVEMAEGVGG